ncbi:hypothetical protein AVEN_194590-1 [Araneus ventricosus]|uniref:Uncharacterized protein n=1 Tax=Araneus ventricosus TaxID=182803 RepID=A0A4Y2A6K0_ARAVE|nr:hypothetical protein AVEN_194590-1 [Araneus ventricosus]
MTGAAPDMAPHLQASASRRREGVRIPYAVFSVQRAQYINDLQWNQVSNKEPSCPKTETLPLGHRGFQHMSDSFFHRKNQEIMKFRGNFVRTQSTYCMRCK